MGISAIATSVGSCFADTIKSTCGFATRHPWMTSAAALATAGALYKWWTNPSRGTGTKQGSRGTRTKQRLRGTRTKLGMAKHAPPSSAAASQCAPVSTAGGNPQAATGSVVLSTAGTIFPSGETPKSGPLTTADNASAPVTGKETGGSGAKNGAATTDNGDSQASVSVVTEHGSTGDITEGHAKPTGTTNANTWPQWLWQRLRGTEPDKQPSESVGSPSESVEPPSEPVEPPSKTVTPPPPAAIVESA